MAVSRRKEFCSALADDFRTFALSSLIKPIGCHAIGSKVKRRVKTVQPGEDFTAAWLALALRVAEAAVVEAP